MKGFRIAGCVLAAALCGCNVSLNPFDLGDGAEVCIDDAAECASGGGDADLDAGSGLPCAVDGDCLDGRVCRAHLCVPPAGDGGAGDAGGDAGASDGGCVEGLALAPPSVDFGIVTAGCSSEDRHVTLSNTGCREQPVYAINITPAGSAMAIVLTPATPFIIGAGASRELVVRYHPLHGSGPEKATLRIEGERGVVQLPMSGAASLSSAVTDSFVQGSPPGASFHLTRLPDAGTIVVTVNGGAVPIGGADGWSYDGAGNNVVFGENAVPRPGEEIAIAYSARCL